MLNVTNIPAPRVNIIDERTGLISREWYRFFLNLFTLVGDGNNQTSLDDVQVGPPTQAINVILSGGGGDDVAPPSSVPFMVLDDQSVAPPFVPVDTTGAALQAGNNTFTGINVFTNNGNQFLGTVYYTSDGATSNGFVSEDSGYATVVGLNGVTFGLGTTPPGTGKVVVATNSLRPYADNSISCGIGAQRWTEVYAVNGTINTSDATEKQQVRELSESEHLVAQKVKKLIRAFKWNDAVAVKGDNARTHFGVMAQDVQAAFAAEGLDASKYGLFCEDTWTTLDGTSQTRLGVRYDELLAFVVAAL